jgi:hypothetical protein
MKDLGTLARKIAKNKARAPFEVIIEYKGTYESGTKLGHIMGPAIIKIMGRILEDGPLLLCIMILVNKIKHT